MFILCLSYVITYYCIQYNFSNLPRRLQFRYSEKVSKVSPIYHFLLDITQQRQIISWRWDQFFVAFSEYLNFSNAYIITISRNFWLIHIHDWRTVKVQHDLEVYPTQSFTQILTLWAFQRLKIGAELSKINNNIIITIHSIVTGVQIEYF